MSPSAEPARTTEPALGLVQFRTRRTRRSTIWQRTPSGWQIIFHQGTIVEEP